MLRSGHRFTNVLVYGAASDLGNAILAELPLEKGASLTLIGRATSVNPENYPKFDRVVYHQHDLANFDSYENLVVFIDSIGAVDLAIMASAVLPNEDEDLNFESVKTAMTINVSGTTSVLSILAKKLLATPNSHLLFISSVASIRPRLRNFTYGATKAAGDFYSLGLGFKYRRQKLFVTVLRPGYVYTKMSENFSPAPFATTPEKVAKIALLGLQRKKTVIYAPRKLKLILNLARITPRFIFNRLG